MNVFYRNVLFCKKSLFFSLSHEKFNSILIQYQHLLLCFSFSTTHMFILGQKLRGRYLFSVLIHSVFLLL
jgi:hypothetical protein